MYSVEIGKIFKKLINILDLKVSKMNYFCYPIFTKWN